MHTVSGVERDDPRQEFPILSDGTLSKIPDNELFVLERHLFGLLQSIRRIRGLPPYETTKHRREMASK